MNATSGDMRRFMAGNLLGSTFIPKGADLTGKTIIVTGANTGLGFEAAKHIARLNASKLILGCRSIEKGNAAKKAISSETYSKNTSVEVWEVDLTSYASVLAFGARVRSTLPRLDGLISNAGLEKMSYTVSEGVETTITVNVISTMLLNIAVLPKLRETSARYKTAVTITTVGSSVHIFGAVNDLMLQAQAQDKKDLDVFDLLSDPATAVMGAPDERMSPRYALSKAILHAVLPKLAERAAHPGTQEQVIINVVNPGWCTSELGRDKGAPGFGQKVMFAAMGRTTEQGSRTLVHGLLAGKESNGRYLTECQVQPESDFLRSEKGAEAREQFWRDLIARIRRISPEVAGFVE